MATKKANKKRSSKKGRRPKRRSNTSAKVGGTRSVAPKVITRRVYVNKSKKKKAGKRRRRGNTGLKLARTVNSRSSMVKVVKFGMTAAAGFLAVNIVANFNPLQTRWGVWGNVGQKLGIALLLGNVSNRALSNESQVAFQAGAITSAFVDLAVAFIPWAAGKVTVLLGNGQKAVVNAAEAGQQAANMGALVDFNPYAFGNGNMGALADFNPAVVGAQDFYGRPIA